MEEGDAAAAAAAPGTGTGTEPLTGTNKAIDYAQLERDVEEQTAIAKEPGKLTAAVETLLNLEKQMRLAADVPGTKRVVSAIVQICRDAGDWKLLNENIVLLSKRRAQLKQAVAAMVQQAMGYIDSTPDQASKVELIKTLSNISAGKMYVEVERARLVKLLAKIKEDEGHIKEAADILQEVAVETFGAMAKTEKIAFILEQVRLCLDNKDLMRAQILAKKINPRVFQSPASGGAETAAGAKKEKAAAEGGGAGGDDMVKAAAPDVPSLMELKLKYYSLMIRYYAESREYLEICRCYIHIYETPGCRDGPPEKWTPVLTKICWNLVLAKHDPMQASLLHSMAADKKLSEDLPRLKSLLKQFLTMEVIPWQQLQQEYAGDMAAETEVFANPKGKEDLQLRVVEHNILVVSKYYSRITMQRLAELLNLSVEESEKHLSSMVVAKALRAKMDRPAGIVTFGAGKESGHAVLDTWGAGISRLLELVETSCHQIHKESMVHKVLLKS